MRRKAVLGNVLIAICICHTVSAVQVCTTDLTGRLADLLGGGLSFVVVAEDTGYSSSLTVKEGDLFWVLMCSALVTQPFPHERPIQSHQTAQKEKTEFWTSLHDDEGNACYRCFR